MSDVEIGRGRKSRRTYGFDDVALVPSAVTLDPEDVDLSCDLAGIRLEAPVLASAMDAVTDPRSAAVLTELGGMGVLHLHGLYCRYEDPAPVFERITSAAPEEAVGVLQEAYQEPVKDDLILRRIEEMRKLGARVAVSPTPAFAERAAEIIGPGKIDVLVVAATVTTAKHISSRFRPPDFAALSKRVEAPVFVGNCVSYEGTACWSAWGPGPPAPPAGCWASACPRSRPRWIARRRGTIT